MANTVQIKRGNNTSVNAHTGPSGEIIYNLDTGRLHAQDGATAGGKPHALMSDVDLKANAATQVIAGSGLTGGGNLSADRTVNVGAGTGISVAADAVSLDAPTIASLAKADTAIQAPGGTTGQVLAKSSATDNDVAWVSSEAATAVSYGPQTLTEAQQGQARANIDADKVYNSVSDVQSSVIDNSVIAIRTNGYYAAGDGGAGAYRLKLAPEVDLPGDKTSNNGTVRWQYVPGDRGANVLAFGARPDRSPVSDPNHYKAPFFDSTKNIKDAVRFAKIMGCRIHAPFGRYRLEDTIHLSHGQWIEGDGVDAWDHLDPNPRLKEWEKGTHFVACGTFEKRYFGRYSNDRRTAGGVVANLDSANGNDTHYRLFNFHNEDATGTSPATVKLFSAAVYIEPYAFNAGLNGIRVVVNHDGISKYRDSLDTMLGDNVDFGVFNDCAAFISLDNTQVVGYWRCGAFVGLTSNDPAHLESFGGPSPAGRMYHSRLKNCIFQGWTGLAIRGGTSYKALVNTSNSVSIAWDASHPFDFAGTFNSPAGTFSYTSAAKVGETLVFNGVSPDPSGIGNGPIRLGNGVGLGGMSIEGCLITGLDHASMTIATNPAYINGKVSKALEIDGLFRNILIDGNTYIQTREDVVADIGMVDDLRFGTGQFEANSYRLVPGGSLASTHGGRLLMRPQDLNNPLSTATGDSSVTLGAWHSAPQVDLYPLRPRSGASKFSSTGAGTGAAGYCNPRRVYWQDLQCPDDDQLTIRALGGQRVRIYTEDSLQVFDRNGVERLYMSPTGEFQLKGGSQLRLTGGGAFINADASQTIALRHGTTSHLELLASGTLQPGTDNTQNFGTSSRRWSTIFAGSGTINTSDARYKQGVVGDPANIKPVDDTVLDAWGDVVWSAYRFNDAVDLKGDDARIHFGVVAQQVITAFESHGINPFDYGIICFDEWGEQEEVIELYTDDITGEENEIVTTPYRAAGSMYSIRYAEAQAIESAWMRREIKRMQNG